MPVCLEVDNKLGRRVLKKCGVRSEIETLLCRVSLMLFLLEEPTHWGRWLLCWVSVVQCCDNRFALYFWAQASGNSPLCNFKKRTVIRPGCCVVRIAGTTTCCISGPSYSPVEQQWHCSALTAWFYSCHTYHAAALWLHYRNEYWLMVKREMDRLLKEDRSIDNWRDHPCSQNLPQRSAVGGPEILSSPLWTPGFLTRVPIQQSRFYPGLFSSHLCLHSCSRGSLSAAIIVFLLSSQTTRCCTVNKEQKSKWCPCFFKLITEVFRTLNSNKMVCILNRIAWILDTILFSCFFF